MSIVWKECTPRDGWRSQSCQPIQPMDQIILVNLYQPLVGATAVSLYLTLYSQLPLHRSGVSRMYSHLDLMKLLQVPLGEMLQARYRLEGIGLLNTFRIQDQDRKIFQYDLVPPLSPSQFFQSDVLSASLVNRLGKERFRMLHEEMVSIKVEEGAYYQSVGEKVTKSFQQVFGSISPAEIWSATEVEKELSSSGVNAEGYSGEEAPSRFSLREEDELAMVKVQLRNVIDESAWTKALEKEVMEIRDLYQLDHWDLIRALQNPSIFQHGKIAIDRLRAFVRDQYRMRFGGASAPVKNTKTERRNQVQPSENRVAEQKDSPETEEDRHFRMLNELSPVELLRHFQRGKTIPKADLELVEDLMQNYGLPPGVINVLLEYVLYSNDYKLPRALVEKIAGHWSRKNVRTVEEAREMARSELDWEWKRRRSEGSRKRSFRKDGNWKKREEALPRAVAQAMEREAKGENPKVEKVDPETEARLRAKLNRMQERLSQRMHEKGNE